MEVVTSSLGIQSGGEVQQQFDLSKSEGLVWVAYFPSVSHFSDAALGGNLSCNKEANYILSVKRSFVLVLL